MASSELLKYFAQFGHTEKYTILFDRNGQMYGLGSIFFTSTSKSIARKTKIDGIKFCVYV